MLPNISIHLKGELGHNNPPAFSSLINLDFLLSHTAHFDKGTGFPLFVFATIRVFTCCFFLHFNTIRYNTITFFYKETKIC